MVLLPLVLLLWLKFFFGILLTKFAFLFVAISMGFLLRGKYLSRQLARNWTIDYAWRVHKQQISMLCSWVALGWLYILLVVVM